VSKVIGPGSTTDSEWWCSRVAEVDDEKQEEKQEEEDWEHSREKEEGR